MHATAGLRGTAILLLIAWVSALIGIAVLVTGGSRSTLARPVRAHNPCAGIVVTLAMRGARVAAWSRAGGQALAWWWEAVERRASTARARRRGTRDHDRPRVGHVRRRRIGFVLLPESGGDAGGGTGPPAPADRVACALAERADDVRAGRSSAGPLAVASRAAIVPACPTGYPLLLAAARLVGGRAAMFWVVPIFGGLAVWWTFVLGRHVAGAVTGVAAAWLLAASPTFLYQITQPMTDVPAARLVDRGAGVAHTPARTPLIGGLRSGLLIGAALLVRPNLVPLVAVAACAVLSSERRSLRDAVRTLTALGLGSPARSS